MQPFLIIYPYIGSNSALPEKIISIAANEGYKSLHIARTIIEAHKRNIWIESELEKGTIGHIRLPNPKHGEIKK
ncbi:hypothetical protein [Methanolobus psychrotolerans]|uniref:hypothetical protein n=1 Tax=Methanolobus psychrotolerans TaxID=1874706 RepID=UPI00101AE2E5|nr:hypothetical protein [Methanolobus psychrotolerans]